jgi:hypothetical protein
MAALLNIWPLYRQFRVSGCSNESKIGRSGSQCFGTQDVLLAIGEYWDFYK